MIRENESVEEELVKQDIEDCQSILDEAKKEYKEKGNYLDKLVRKNNKDVINMPEEERKKLLGKAFIESQQAYKEYQRAIISLREVKKKQTKIKNELKKRDSK